MVKDCKYLFILNDDNKMKISPMHFNITNYRMSKPIAFRLTNNNVDGCKPRDIWMPLEQDATSRFVATILRLKLLIYIRDLPEKSKGEQSDKNALENTFQNYLWANKAVKY